MTKNNDKRARVLVLGSLGRQLEDAGGVGLNVSYSDPRAADAISSGGVHALVLTGGGDIAPKLYGQRARKQTQTPNPQRDLVELKALEAALRTGIPVLGICRGAQMINAAFGGTLHQHLGDSGAKHAHGYHLGHDHRVKVESQSKLRRTLAKAEPWVVSIHHQAVDNVAPGFRAVAHSLDGIVEAIESQDGRILGVQFHPEIATNGTTQRIFNALVRDAARIAGLPKPVRPRKPKLIKPALSPKAASKVLDTRSPWERERERRAQQVPVRVTYQCFRCSIRFDDRTDHLDHMFLLHGVNLAGDAFVEERA